jgi:pimeloyl-ACP methyl ester carboxylesterase
MREQAQTEPGDDPVANLGAITLTATTSCTDALAPGDSSYDNVRAAEDLERLRSTWDVPALALLGIGNGAQVALAYTGSHPDKVARLILVSPTPPWPKIRSRHSSARSTTGPPSAWRPTACWDRTRRVPSTGYWRPRGPAGARGG